MGKINSKDKGARFERELAEILRGYGYECRRGVQYSGKAGDADVIGLPDIHIEAKHQERMMLYEWMEQAISDASKNGRMPAVFHKKNRADILVTMRLTDWIILYKDGHDNDEKKDIQEETESKERT